MLKAILVDDEKHALNLLSKVIQERNDVQVIGAFTDAAELLDQAEQLLPDIVFLDIEMAEMDGLQLAERLRAMGLELDIVFVTAYRQYALDAFGVQAIDYLLKPIEPEMLGRAIDRIQIRRQVHTPKRTPLPGCRIECFGGLAVYKDGQAEPIRFPTAKAEELFAYMLMHRNTNLSKWTLCDSLWPEQGGSKNSENNLHTTVYRMKKVLREHGIDVRLSSKRGFYRLECDFPCDYIRFEQDIAGLVKADDSSPDTLLEMMQLYKGALFAGLDYPWCEAERERMTRHFTALAKKLASYYTADGQHNKAIDTLLGMLGHVPYDGEAYDMLLRIFLAVQDKASFVMHYEKMKRMFQEELGLEPPPELAQLYSSMRA